MRTTLLTSALCAVTLCGVASADIVNGGFETGDFTGWTMAGFIGQTLPRDDSGSNHNYESYIANQNAGTATIPTNSVETSQTSAFFDGASSPAINPTEGTYLAFLDNETAAGAGILEGSSITQSFVVGPGATSLTFDIQFLTNEDVPSTILPAGTGWDFGGFALLHGSAAIQQFNLDELLASPANAHAMGTASGGFTGSTGWLSGSFDLSGLEGQSLTLVGYVTDTGLDPTDTLGESRLLLDNIQLVEADSPVPEASSLSLLLVAGGLLGLFRKRLAR